MKYDSHIDGDNHSGSYSNIYNDNGNNIDSGSGSDSGDTRVPLPRAPIPPFSPEKDRDGNNLLYNKTRKKK